MNESNKNRLPQSVRPEKIGNFAANRGGGYQDKVRRVSAAKPHNYQKKKKKSSSALNGVMDIAGFTLSDLEDDDEENFEEFEIFM